MATNREIALKFAVDTVEDCIYGPTVRTDAEVVARLTLRVADKYLAWLEADGGE